MSSMPVSGFAATPVYHLSRSAIAYCLTRLDAPAIINDVYRLHDCKQTVLPSESYLEWRNALGELARSISLSAYIGGDILATGTKLINANPANIHRDLPRASGFVVLYDVTTARPICIMDAALISARRTAAVSVVAAKLLGLRKGGTMGVIGAGIMGREHILLSRQYLDVARVVVHDANPAKAIILRNELKTLPMTSGCEIVCMGSAEEVARESEFLVTCTTTTTGYISPEWIQPGSLLSHVSLDDLQPEAALSMDRIFVDDWSLVRDDRRRLLGRLYQDGRIKAADAPLEAPGRRISGTLSDLVMGRVEGRTKPNQTILFNPFGCAISDIGLAAAVYRLALKEGLGLYID